MNLSRHNLELGATAASTNILVEETKRLGQRAVKVSTRDCLLFDSWFLSKKAAYSSVSIVVDFIGMVKTNTKFCKASIEGLTKYCLADPT